MKVLVTGGAGFIGSELVRQLVAEQELSVINIDKLTYAGNLNSLKSIKNKSNYKFYKLDICDKKAISTLIKLEKPDALIHLAAESHVDRSIEGPRVFLETNILGTFNLLEASCEYYKSLSGEKKNRFRFHHVSTDEVYGSCAENDFFTETTAYEPNSPYSASKASSDHLVRAWHKTYGLPVLITNCSNNYGPYQFPEKLIPLMITKALAEESLPIYGDGKNVRDWLYVSDHTRALRLVLEKGKVGEVYNIGGSSDVTNISLVDELCNALDKLSPRKNQKSYLELKTFVKDRPGHDLRYAIDASKIQKDLAWQPEENLKSGLQKTIMWYLENKAWWLSILDGSYQKTENL